MPSWVKIFHARYLSVRRVWPIDFEDCDSLQPQSRHDTDGKGENSTFRGQAGRGSVRSRTHLEHRGTFTRK